METTSNITMYKQNALNLSIYRNKRDKENLHFMIDIETFAKGEMTAFFSIAIVPFDSTKVYNHCAFYRKIDIDSIPKEAKIDPSTVKWWLEQSKKAQEEVNGTNDFITTLFEMRQWFEQIFNEVPFDKKKIWARSPSFDLVIINSWLDHFDYGRIWQFYEEEDMRTIESVSRILAMDEIKFEGVKHSAIDDTINQAKKVSFWLRELEIIKGIYDENRSYN